MGYIRKHDSPRYLSVIFYSSSNKKNLKNFLDACPLKPILIIPSPVSKFSIQQ